jgi:hypothetical protein
MKLKNYCFLALFALLFIGCSVGSTQELNSSPQNAINLIKPYLYEGVWVFDDASKKLKQEPFVSGIPEMIDQLVANIPNAEKGFLLYFSENTMPETMVELRWLRAADGGNWYKADAFDKEGWLCPALYKYYAKAPQKLYIRAAALKR